MATVTMFYQSVHNLKKFIAAFTSTASLGLNPSHRCHRARARRAATSASAVSSVTSSVISVSSGNLWPGRCVDWTLAYIY